MQHIYTIIRPRGIHDTIIAYLYIIDTRTDRLDVDIHTCRRIYLHRIYSTCKSWENDLRVW